MIRYKQSFVLIYIILIISACNSPENNVNSLRENSVTVDLDTPLRTIISTKNLTGNALKGRDLPTIESPKAQLGMHLFFSKSLGGDHDSACVTCHHPLLGGGDNLSLPIGVGAELPNKLGEGRVHSHTATGFDGSPPVPRNSPTTFNIAAWDKVLFHDGRIESLGKTVGASGDDGQGIRTPDTQMGESDPLSGSNMVIAQARFPITSREEMMGFNHNDMDNQDIRHYLASRMGGYGAGEDSLENTDYWLAKFQTAFDNPIGTAEALITEQNIAHALAEYERSQAFSHTPWRAYIEGDDEAISQAAKQGALLFFRSHAAGGAACASCHSGDLFSDENFHNIAIPQIGRGKGDGEDGTADFGRFRESALAADKYAFRTPSLLNVEVTKPWSHTGAYTSLVAIIEHHLDPASAVENYDAGQLIQADIANIEKMQANTQPAVDKLEEDRLAGLAVIQNVTLNSHQVSQLVDFLKTLTDPCVKDRDCLAKWIPKTTEDPNEDQLEAINTSGESL